MFPGAERATPQQDPAGDADLEQHGCFRARSGPRRNKIDCGSRRLVGVIA
jgi:hypothetical protein